MHMPFVEPRRRSIEPSLAQLKSCPLQQTAPPQQLLREQLLNPENSTTSPSLSSQAYVRTSLCVRLENGEGCCGEAAQVRPPSL